MATATKRERDVTTALPNGIDALISELEQAWYNCGEVESGDDGGYDQEYREALAARRKLRSAITKALSTARTT